ncbi:MAG TPA: ROK family transcriptional regulator [Firmicutes bacterium]|nr:ROK family transcriptional regulator [Bacillota bacterium]
MRKAGNVMDLQDSNLELLLEIIRNHDDVSRQDLAEKSGLSPAGVSKLVSLLISKGIVYEDALMSTRKGRRAIRLKINRDAMYAVGIRFARQYVKCGLFNVKGELLYSSYEPLQNFTVQQTVDLMVEMAAEVLRECGDRRERVVGVGISAPGPLLAREGKIALISNSPGWRNISLAKTIETRLGIPTFLEHDANASALAEKWFGKGTTANHLVFIAVGQGVGAGVLANGQILSGHLNVAGEIGHTTIDYNGPLCDCGNRGCLEMYSSSLALVRRARETARDEQPPGWPKPEEIDAEKVFALARTGDETALKLIRQVGHFLGIGVVNVINTYNPDMIVLGDEMAEAGEPWLQAVKEVVEKRVIPELRSETIIELSELPIEPAFLGAGALVIKRVFGNLSRLPNSARFAVKNA